MEARDLIAK